MNPTGEQSVDIGEASSYEMDENGQKVEIACGSVEGFLCSTIFAEYTTFSLYENLQRIQLFHFLTKRHLQDSHSCRPLSTHILL